jgi:hypothetical protein
MPANHIGLIGLGVLILTASATAVLAQSNTLLPPRHQAPVSPALPGPTGGVLTNSTTGTNPLTGLPCSGTGSLSVSGAGGLPGSTAEPVTGTLPQTPAFPSVFGSTATSGAC